MVREEKTMDGGDGHEVGKKGEGKREWGVEEWVMRRMRIRG